MTDRTNALSARLQEMSSEEFEEMLEESRRRECIERWRRGYEEVPGMPPTKADTDLAHVREGDDEEK